MDLAFSPARLAFPPCTVLEDEIIWKHYCVTVLLTNAHMFCLASIRHNHVPPTLEEYFAVYCLSHQL